MIDVLDDLPNLNKPAIHIRHSNLIRKGDSRYRSYCPVCTDGTLLVYRNPKTLKLEELDMCIVCAQRFIYDDIEDLKEEDFA